MGSETVLSRGTEGVSKPRETKGTVVVFSDSRET